MTVGNGGGVELKLNGKSLGVPGEVGKVVRIKVPKDAELLRYTNPSAKVEPEVEVSPKVDDPAAQAVPKPGDSVVEDDGFD